MRIALLSAQYRGSDGELVAGFKLAGRSLLEWQIDLAVHLGCERVMCLAEGASPEILQAQHFAERRNLEFHSVKGVLQLTALIANGHEIVMIQDGLWLNKQHCLEEMGPGQTIASLADTAGDNLRRGFERIDRERLWAGFAIIPSRLVGKLADFPADSDCMSMLLRLALQAGIPVVEIENERLIASRWQLLDRTADRVEIEQDLLQLRFERSGLLDPGNLLASAIARRALSSDAGIGQWMIAAAAGICLFASLALVWWGLPVLGLATAALGSFGVSLHNEAREYSVQVLGDERSMLDQGLGMLRDALVCGGLAIIAIEWDQAFLPVFVIGLLALAERLDRTATRQFWSDRPLHLLILTAANLLGQLELGLIVLGLVTLGALLLREVLPQDDELTPT